MNKRNLGLMALVLISVTPMIAQAFDLQSLADKIVNYMTIFGAALAAVMIIYVGILFLLARGEADKVSEARMALLWGVVGVAIIFGATAIITWAKTLLTT